MGLRINNEKFLIKSYRNCDLEFALSSDITLFVGENSIGKSSIINLIEYTKTFFKIEENDKECLKNSKPFWILHKWEERKSHNAPFFEWIEFMKVNKNGLRFINRYSTFIGNDLIFFDFSNDYKYKILKNPGIGKDIDLKKLFKYIKSQYSSKHSNEFNSLLVNKINNMFLFTNESSFFNKIENVFGLVYIFENNFKKNDQEWMSNYKKVAEINDKEFKSKISRETEIKQAKRFIHKEIIIPFFDKGRGARLYFQNKESINMIEGIRPQKIDDFKASDIKNLFDKFNNEHNIKIANDFLFKSGFSYKLKVGNYDKNGAQYNYLFLEDLRSKTEIDINDGGDGIKQILPLLVSEITLSKGINIFKEPEVHMHPKANAEFASLIYKNQNHRSTIIETHSFELVERLRYEHSVSNKQKQVILNTLFLSNKSTVNNEMIEFNKDGRIPGAKKYMEFFNDEALKWFK